jgi:hypothetical protein
VHKTPLTLNITDRPFFQLETAPANVAAGIDQIRRRLLAAHVQRRDDFSACDASINEGGAIVEIRTGASAEQSSGYLGTVSSKAISWKANRQAAFRRPLL